MGTPGSLKDPSPVLILFDGVCNLCNGVVQFIIKRDPKARFKFGSLQSDAARSYLLRFNLDPDALHSIVVIEGDQAFERSDAALRIAKHLGSPWNALLLLKILPKFFRDACYNLIAANRYRMFGKQDHCMIPSPELKERFID